MHDIINVIVVGAGFGGLSTAISLRRVGCNVSVYELSKDLSRQGDVIMLGSNASRVISQWPGMLEKIRGVSSLPTRLRICDKSGRLLVEQPLPSEFDGFPNSYANRTKVQNYMYEYAKEIGVQFTFNARIVEYFEDEDHAGIVFNGERVIADVVVAADSVHSRARAHVTKKPGRAQKSGFAVYRSWFNLDSLKDNPLTRPIAEADEDDYRVWIGENTHAILTTNRNLRAVTVFCTHKDAADIEESWNAPGKVEDMLKVVDGWDPLLQQLVKSIPEEVLIDYKLLWRDPVRQWVSDGGRIVLVGDAAHPHLPTSGTGGAQAIEDGATLGVLIKKAGKKDIRRALKIFEKLRFERTSLTQRAGWELRHRWHQTDWDAVAKDPSFLNQPQPRWLYGHDAADYAEANYDAVSSHLEKGTPFTARNVPDGYVHEDWTISQMMAKEGVKAEPDFYKVEA
ncbi:hypothetical protein Z517_05771 [Fonsecaea pedrosoi CBS 271.37]|uniref:FAD-binding domain-containing protein n=1 Tax=Fonsecaea pedrosoi CBS 271.37 TaxID=1442368 RepID=A0A0D2H3F3_9EURO|nr:uncharacterized protein Z517_05771 [Fonsecaea pedrosoi CBS 271.37]KIW79159.1 hypothetical protein Z517_05771 [Fonsecaea pedrosoi CBS 271.37]